MDVTTGFGGITWRLALLGVGMGLTMAPATESIMGSLPLARAGVGSAVNDTTRELGGAVGVAVIGSVFSSVYGSQIVDALHGQPQSIVTGAKSWVGAALAIASRLPARGSRLRRDRPARLRRRLPHRCARRRGHNRRRSRRGPRVPAARPNRADVERQAEEFAEERSTTSEG